MSTTKTAAALFLAATSGPCGSSTGSVPDAPSAPSWECAHAFDTACRYEAQVTLDAGTLTTASIAPLGDTGARSLGSFEGVTGSVTLTDRQGVVADLTCDFAVDLAFQSDNGDGRALVTIDADAVLSDGCPLDCAWFLPSGGDFSADGGQFRLKMFEGQWELELGASEPDSPEYGPLWLYTEQSSVEFGAGVELTAPVSVMGGSWTVPMDVPADSWPTATCP